MELLKKFSYFLFVLLVVLGSFSCRKSNDEPDAPSVRKTLFMYMPWSGNLTSYFYDNISDMENAVARVGLKNERIIVFISTSASEAVMFELKYEGGKSVRETLKKYTSPAFTTENGLTSILNDMKSFAPAAEYAMVIGCHGMGWLPVYGTGSRSDIPFKPHWEYTDGPLTRYFGGLTPVYQTDITTLSGSISRAGLKMEFILFDDCYMSSIEVAYELRHVTDYLIACPTEVMAFGMPYSTLGQYLLGEPDYRSVCDEFYRFYSSYQYPYGTLGVTDCSELDAMAALMKEINSICTFDNSGNGSVQRMDGYDPVIFYDFGDYVRQLCAGHPGLLQAFDRQLAKVTPYVVHTEKFYSARSGPLPIHVFSGITTSAPSTNPQAAGWVNTSWYQATH